MRLDGRRQSQAARPAERLLRLERLDRALSARMHKDQVRRRVVQEEMRALRVGFTHADDELYRSLRFLAEGR